MAGTILNYASIGIKITVDEIESVSGLTDIPDMGATPEKLDVTTLLDSARKYIDGVKDYGDLEFSFLYESAADGNYAKLAAIEKKCKEQKHEATIKVTFPDGATFEFKGSIALKINGVGVNAVITFTMSVALSSDITYTAAAGA